jgi:hypothetical protein
MRVRADWMTKAKSHLFVACIKGQPEVAVVILIPATTRFKTPTV